MPLTVMYTAVAVLAGIQAEREHQCLNPFLNQNDIIAYSFLFILSSRSNASITYMVNSLFLSTSLLFI